MPNRRNRITSKAITATAVLLTLVVVLAGCGAPAPRRRPVVPAQPATASVEPTAAAEPTSSVSATGSVEIGWVGDTLMGSRYGLAPRGGRALFADVVEHLRAPDLMTGNLEGTLSTAKRSKSDGSDSKVSFSFQAPPSYAKALVWAGFDVVSLANNHAHDFLEAGLTQTKRALDDNGVAYTGLPGQIRVKEANGIRVAFLAFSPYGWNADIGDLPRARELVREASEQAEIVVVMMHAGAEGADRTHTPNGAETAFGEFRGNPRAFAHAVIDAGADAVFGSGPHVVRGIERYRGKPIAYSLGNFAFWGGLGRAGNLGLTGMLTVRIDRDGEFLGGRWRSMRIVGRGTPEIDPGAASAKLVRRVSKQDFTSRFAIDASGTITAP